MLLVDACELQKLRLELQEARNEVNRMNQEMHSQHVARSTIEHLGQSSEADYGYTGDVTEQTLTQLQNKFNASTCANYSWGNEPIRPPYSSNSSIGTTYQTQARPPPVQSGHRRNGFLNEPIHFPLDQSFRGSGMSGGLSNGMSNSFTSGMTSTIGHSLGKPPSRPGSAFDPLYNQYAAPQMYAAAQMAPVGTMGSTLSPGASEFNVAMGLGPSPWNSQVGNLNTSFILSTNKQNRLLTSLVHPSTSLPPNL